MTISKTITRNEPGNIFELNKSEDVNIMCVVYGREPFSPEYPNYVYWAGYSCAVKTDLENMRKTFYEVDSIAYDRTETIEYPWGTQITHVYYADYYL